MDGTGDHHVKKHNLDSEINSMVYSHKQDLDLKIQPKRGEEES